MIKEAYVNFELAKLLKEKGFDVPVKRMISSNNLVWSLDEAKDINAEASAYYSQPTHQMAMRWLREIFKLEIYPFHDAIQEDNNWWYRIEYHQKGCSITKYESEPTFFSYEEAVEAALKYCLENLI